MLDIFLHSVQEALHLGQLLRGEAVRQTAQGLLLPPDQGLDHVPLFLPQEDAADAAAVRVGPDRQILAQPQGSKS